MKSFIDDSYKPEANKIFTDREQPRETFWKNYNKMKAQIEETNKADMKVITFYGIGGVGKSKLLEKLEEELREKEDKPFCVRFNFENENESVGVLERLKNMLFKQFGFKFLLFEIALDSYKRKTGEFVNKEAVQENSDENPFFSFLSKAINLIPGVEMASQVLETANKGISWISDSVKKHNRAQDINEIKGMPQDELYEKLPVYFAKDMNDNLDNKKVPFVVFLDTYEKLVNEMDMTGDPTSKDLWLRGDNGLVPRIPKVLWVIAGREKLKWADKDPDWNGTLEQHLLDSLSEKDASDFLRIAGIRDESLISGIYKLTGGTPLLLDLCVDTYYRIKDRKVPAIGDFGNNSADLIDRYVRYMNRSQQRIVYMLSCFEIWDDELIRAAADKVIDKCSIDDIADVCKFSFISEVADGSYMMHKTVAEVLYRNCDEGIKGSALTEALDFYFNKLKSNSIYSARFSSWLKSAVRIADRKYTDDGDFGDFLEKKLWDIYNNLSNAHRFELIFSSLQPAIERAQRNSNTVLEMFILEQEAMAFKERGIRDEALSCYRREYEISSKVHGKAAPETLNIMKYIGSELSRSGNYEESIKIQKEIIEIYRSELGPYHLDTVNALFNCAYSMKNEEKEVFLKEILAKFRDDLGENDKLTIRAMDGLADFFEETKRSDEALQLKREIIEKRKVLFGKNSPETLYAMADYASTLSSCKRYIEAAECYKELIGIYKTAPEDNSSIIVNMLSALADELKYIGQKEEALNTLKEALEICRDFYGDAHERTIKAANDLSWSLKALHRDDEALKLQREIYGRCIDCIGREAPETVNAMCSLAHFLACAEKYDEALKLRLEALDILRKVKGKHHNSVFDLLNVLDFDFYKTGMFEERLQLWSTEAESRKNELGETDPKTIEALYKLADTLDKLYRYEEALEIYQKIYETQKSVLSETSYETVDALKMVASELKKLERYEEALDAYQKIYETQKSVYGEDHRKTKDAEEEIEQVRENIRAKKLANYK